MLAASVGAVLPVGGLAVMCSLGIVSGLGLPVLSLKSAIARRRRRLEGELVPLLELFTLELSGGGSAVTALGSVTMQVQGELAADLRRLLIASQVAGSATFETRLIEYSERLQIRAIGSLATILAASREYGTGVVHGVRALATDLRRAQRRELIAHSRHALNQVLVPAAVGVLLPFLAILMFPAVSALHENLR
jgi:pilus assembly protein TadC